MTTARIGLLEKVLLEILAEHDQRMAVGELREQVLQRHGASNNGGEPTNERSFAASFSRALKSLERKGLLQLRRRPNVSRWPQHQGQGTVYLVALKEMVA